MYKSQSVMTVFVLQGHIWLFDKCSAEVMYLSSCDTDLNCLNVLVWFRNRFYFSHTAHSSELWGIFDSHYQQTQYDRPEHKSCNSTGCLQTHLFLCAPDPILMIRLLKGAPARPVKMLQCPVFRWSPAAFSSCVSVTGFHISRAHTVIHCAARGSVWMGLLTGSLSTAPAQPRTEEHGSRLTHLAGTAHHVPPAQTKATLYWRLLRIIPSAPLSVFIKTRKMKMKERASCTYTLLKIKMP